MIHACEKMNPNRILVVTHKTHLMGFNKMLYLQHRVNMVCRSWRWYTHFFELAVRSSRKDKMNSVRSLNMSFLSRRWHLHFLDQKE